MSKCGNYNNHVSKFKTGFCDVGYHEGQKPRAYDGTPVQVCKFWLTCACQCHKQISQMFDMVGETRRWIDNPEYTPPVRTYWMPEPGRDMEQPETFGYTVKKSDHEGVPDTVVREYASNDSGRSGRGELEQNVKLACDDWIKGEHVEDCTTKWVSEWIFDNLGVLTAPSRGAIDAVWKRWVELGFCMMLGNPTQFVCYTPVGIQKGLEGLKDEAKRKRKRMDTDIKLGRRR